MGQAEAKVVINAADNSAGPLAAFLGRLNALSAPLDGLKNRLMGSFPTSALEKFKGGLGGLTTKLAAIGVGAGVGIGGLALVKSGFDAVVDTAEKADRIGDLGGRLRLNANEFQVFEKLAKDSGASVEEVGGSFLKFKLNLSTAQNEGGEKLKKLNSQLAAFGLTAKQAASMQPLQLMQQMGKVSANSNTESDELLKIELFRSLAGKTGATLIPVFEAIGTKYESVLSNMRSAGVLMTDEMAERGGAAFKAYEKSQGAAQGLKTAFGIEMMPVFERFSNIMESRMKANRTAMMPGVKALAGILSTNVLPFLDGMDRVADKTSGIFKVLSKVAGLVGWDNLVFGGLALLAAPFIASAGAVVVGLYGMTSAAFFASVGMLSRLVPSFVASTAAAWANGGAMGVARLGIASVGGAARATAASVMGMVRPLAVAGVMAYSTGGAMGVITLIAGTVTTALGAAATAALSFTAALLTNPITWIVVAIAAAAYLIYAHWGGVKTFFSGFWDGLVSSFKPLDPLFQGFAVAADLVGSRLGFVGTAASWVGGQISGLVSWFSELFGVTHSGINQIEDWSSAGQKAAGILVAAVKLVLFPLRLVGVVVERGISLFTTLFDFVSGFKLPEISIPDIAQRIRANLVQLPALATNAFANMRSVGGAAADWVGGAWQKAVGMVRGFKLPEFELPDMARRIADNLLKVPALVSGTFANMRSVGGSAADWVGGAWRRAVGAVQGFSLADIKVPDFRAALAPLTGMVASLLSPMLEPLRPVFDWLYAAFGKVADVSAVVGSGFNLIAGLARYGATAMAEWGRSGSVMSDLLGAGVNLLLAPFRALLALIDAAVAGFKLLGNLLPTLPSLPSLPSFLMGGGAAGVAGAAAGAQAPASSPSLLAQLPAPSLAQQRTDVGGRLDIRVMSDGQVRTERVESNTRGFEIDARSGQMFAG